jgi:hypothetical protein
MFMDAQNYVWQLTSVSLLTHSVSVSVGLGLVFRCCLLFDSAVYCHYMAVASTVLCMTGGGGR